MAWIKSLVLVGFLTGLSRITYCVQVTLLDTSKESALNWMTHGAGARRGWREASYNLANGEALRVYTVCNVALTSVDNWLRTPYIARGEAQLLYVEIKFTMRKCVKYPDPERLQQCKESFKLLYFGADSDFANAQLPTWDTTTYHHIDTIAADQVFESITEAVINTEERSVAMGVKGGYFAFQDQGACATLISVRVYYKMCPSVTKHFAIFPNTSTGPDEGSIVQQPGVCVPHAAIERLPTNICTGDGAWNLITGGCKCMPGYEPDSDTACVPCQLGKYKWRTGSQSCDACPGFSVSRVRAAVECMCVEGYYRSPLDEKNLPCTRPPSPVRSVNVTFTDQSMLNLSWAPPSDLGGRRDLEYKVVCQGCKSTVTFRPGNKGFNSTKLSLQGLYPNTEYKIFIYAENGVSQVSRREVKTHIWARTEQAMPSQVRLLHIADVGMDYISVAWETPEQPHAQIEEYEVLKFRARASDNSTVFKTTRTNVTFNNLLFDTKYGFQVRGRTKRGFGEFSDPVYATTGHNFGTHIKPGMENTQSSISIIAGSAVAVITCFIIVIIMVIIFLRRNHRACNEKNVSDCDTLQYSNVQCPHVLDGTHVMNGGLTIPLFSPPGAVKTYVDPHTYEDPNQAVREFTKEIDASYITIESVIGGGEFGDVCKGKLRMPGKGDLAVAIKTLKAGASDKNRLDFLTEASIMGQFDDPNVIYLEGVVTKSNPIMIVTEYMENGSLDQFLRNNDGKFTVIQLVGMMRGIASGMRYLAEMGYVHRDLAARNILVNETLVCKVADFGLSREIETDQSDGAYTTKGGKIPVRWTAPEAIAYRKFTSASDVWSYGVVMWEVMSFGERPYWNWSNHDVITAVEKGFRLPPPMDCPEAVYQLLLDCWQKERSHRPKFTAIVKTLDKLIRAPELLRKIAKPRPDQLLDPQRPDLTSYSTIDEWLTSLKMERYIEHFAVSGYTNMEQVAQITLKDLISLGVQLVGHQKKIMNSVQTLRAQLYGAQVSDGGFLV